MTDTTPSDYPCNCRSCGTIISPSVTDMCEECKIAAERNYKKFYTPMADLFDRMRAESDWLKAELTLRAEIERLRNERDEARRLYCIAFQEITENLGEKNTTESIAEEMGWDCFKENTNG